VEDYDIQVILLLHTGTLSGEARKEVTAVSAVFTEPLSVQTREGEER
jgi:hypothetical protein